MKLFEQPKALLKKQELPLIPMRELVVFPHMVVPFFVGRKGSVGAIDEAMEHGKRVFLACQRNQSEEPTEEDIYQVGTVAQILQMLKLPDGTIRLLVEGEQRGRITRYTRRKPTMRVQIRTMRGSDESDASHDPLMRTVRTAFKRYSQFHKKISPDVVTAVEEAEYADKLVDLVCANTKLGTEKKIEILSMEEPYQRLEELAMALESENEMLDLQGKIHTKVKKRIEKSQRDYFLNEQLKEIRRELGDENDDPGGVRELEQRLKEKDIPDEVRAKAEKELARLSRLQPISPESGVLRTYLEWIADLPWSEKSEDNRDIDLAQKILDEDHYNLKKAKERILDFLAVRQLQEKMKGPILCFVGPPGTGKTSLGRSVARALNREFVRVSLGGVRDEAEIRGHRKTYVGALPGKIIQSMKRANTINPVFLLDEIDKLSSDFRGDPAAALLEVLDPEQNSTFVDHYLEVPYDLSNVLFITTANSLYTIPPALRDRMEVLEIPGYTEFEKLRIAQQFIVPKQLRENGIDWANVRFQQSAILHIIRDFTMEAGVRNLEREIATMMRKTARRAIRQGFPARREEGEMFSAGITPRTVDKYLGKPRFQRDVLFRDHRPGLAYGLAWTEMGGTLLPVEVALIEGKGDLILTGNLGEVMKESARIALSFLRSVTRRYRLAEDFQERYDLHIHVPEGAIPKDGPSAGVTLTAAMLSALSGVALRQGIAMTGEVTLTGRLLPVGGIKEKVLAAHRNKIATVVLPERNRRDIEELPKEILGAMTFLFADSVTDALSDLFPDDAFPGR